MSTRTCEYDLIGGKKVFAGVIQLKNSRSDHPGLFRQALGSVVSISTNRRGEEDTDKEVQARDAEETPCEDKGRD